jgi:hypothetical protein
MDVVVDHRDPRQSAGAGICGADRNAVVQAEAHRARGFGMMAGRPHHRQCAAARFLVQHVVDARQHRPGGKAGDLVGFRRGEGVGIEHRRPAARRGNGL